MVCCCKKEEDEDDKKAKKVRDVNAAVEPIRGPEIEPNENDNFN